MAMKDLIFFPNPFGFGPTSKVIALINVSKDIWNNVNIHYVADDECQQIFNNKEIDVINANPRDYTQVEKILCGFSNPYVVSSLNRFAIRVAHEKGIPNCFIDSLTWMWKEIPKEYLLTDLYFALDFPGVNIVLNRYPSIIKVPYFIDKKAASGHFVENDILVHVGGCINPLIKKCPESFLKLICLAISKIKNKKILVSGGQEAVSFMSGFFDGKNVQCKTLKKEAFLSALLHTKHFVTTSGLNASLEAFNYGIPTSFLMPTNLSQWENLQVFDVYKAAPNKVTWEDIIEQNMNIHAQTEKAAIEIIIETADKVLEQPPLKKKCIELLEKVCMIIPDKQKQGEFIKSIGSNGAEVVAKILQEKWEL